jgi:hypothetical protein
MEIIKEIEFKATNPWERKNYQEDRNDLWDYKYGICTLKENGVVDDHNGWRRAQELSNTRNFLEYQMHGLKISKCCFG